MIPFINFIFLCCIFMMSRSLSSIHHHTRCILMRMNVLLRIFETKRNVTEWWRLSVSELSSDFNSRDWNTKEPHMTLDVPSINFSSLCSHYWERRNATWNKRKEIIVHHKTIRLPRMFYYSTISRIARAFRSWFYERLFSGVHFYVSI